MQSTTVYFVLLLCQGLSSNKFSSRQLALYLARNPSSEPTSYRSAKAQLTPLVTQYMLAKPVLIILIIESAPPDASKGIAVGQAARASAPSSYLRLWAAMSCKSWKVRMSHTLTAPSCPPDTIKLG